MPKYQIRIDDEENIVDLELVDENTYRVSFKGINYQAQIQEFAGDEEKSPEISLQPDMFSIPAAATTPAPKPAPAPTGTNIINSPLAGTIVKVNVTPGVRVQKGTLLCVLEAMKMETDILAPGDATIETVQAKQGDTVQAGDILFTLG